MDKELKDALETLEQVIGSLDLWIEAPLECEQIQFINNLELVHYHISFLDQEAPMLKRYLYRTWNIDSGSHSYDS